MSERINLTLNDDICSKIDLFRHEMLMTRQEFVKYLVCDRLKVLDRLSGRDAEEMLKLSAENELLNEQLSNLKRDFQSITGRPPKIR